MPGLQEVFQQDPYAIKSILVVDDDLDFSLMVKMLLETFEPCWVILAANGYQALDIVRNVAPDLFLLDYRLPGMNGMELYHLLHANGELSDVPVLFVSAHASKETFEEHDLFYLGKPFEINEFLQKVEVLLTG